ncbi:hypothetical protein EG328_009318 [Venturia inaequalis]|uniref:Uncharacterized protein n=1 Tax=Venturia inaequalis TaxID=5025 RepID=A0A8H3YW21_VENIN|nr:hypothetical protein EG328_009318 [Venturia inaequalis]KAE9975789.1 hypothetical protein EG327_008337 [Venturia inaequalis]
MPSMMNGLSEPLFDNIMGKFPAGQFMEPDRCFTAIPTENGIGEYGLQNNTPYQSCNGHTVASISTQSLLGSVAFISMNNYLAPIGLDNMLENVSSNDGPLEMRFNNVSFFETEGSNFNSSFASHRGVFKPSNAKIVEHAVQVRFRDGEEKVELPLNLDSRDIRSMLKSGSIEDVRTTYLANH